MRKRILALIFALVVVGGVAAVRESQTLMTFNPFSVFGKYETERTDGGYFTLVDDKGKVIDQTALGVMVGDEFIAPDNKRYKVVKIQGDVAYTEYVGTEKLAWDPAWDDNLTASTGSKAAQAKAASKAPIAIYHSHSDESYVPTDGKSSIYGNGGIYKVGKSFSGALKNEGVGTLHSYNKHDPHDAGAYHRSRRTAAQLLKSNPLALIDVHRDAVPPQVYKAQIKGEPVTKVKLVVGRQNPHMATTMAFAKKIKAYVDKTHPGLIEGIFIAHGNYNQDLSPRAILIEVGSHTNSRIDAERGVSLFADAIPKVVGAQATPGSLRKGVQPPTGTTVKTERNSGAWTSLAWILGIVLVGGAIFLLISTGSIKGSVDKVKHFTGTEFANFLGRKEVDNIKEENLTEACPGGQCAEETVCPDGQCVEETTCPDGQCIEDNACPDGQCVEDTACPGGQCLDNKSDK